MQSLEEIQHFGLTVRRSARSRVFYFNTLGFPLLSESVVRGGRCEEMYRLREPVNHITWYQIADRGMETFYLPRHPSAAVNAGDIRRPGFRYMAFLADGLENYARRLAAAGLDLSWAASRSGRCFRIQDPDGIQLLFFDSGRASRAGAVSGLKEIGLVAADPEGYNEFFDAVGLFRTEDDADFLSGLFGLEAPAPLYGNVRLVCLPGAAHPLPRRCFPATRADPAAPFSEAGIRHAAFYVADLDSFYRRGLEMGIYFLFDPVRVPGGSRITYFLDPEGNTFEAMQVHPAARAAAGLAGGFRGLQMDAAALLRRYGH